MTLSRNAIIASLLLCSAPRLYAASNDFIVESTTSGGTPETAKPYLDQFTAYAQKRLSGFAPLAFSFFNERKTTEVAIDSTHPGFGMLDLDLFLERRTKDDLIVLAAVQGSVINSGHLHVVVKDPAYKTLDDLKGKVIVSNHLQSPKFLTHAVFADKYDAEKAFTLQPTPSPLKGMKLVDRGEAAATIIDDAQLANMKTLPYGAGLRVIFSSPTLPATPFVAFGKVAKPDERLAVQKMLYGMCADPKGAEVCKSLQITKFEPPNQKLYDDVIKRYEK